MDTKNIRKMVAVMLLSTAFITTGCSQTKTQENNQKPTETAQQQPASTYKVTFIELGSVRCIPCQKMQPIMKSVEEKYGKQVKVTFYDVWTPLGKPQADKYNIQLIPTQVFLDENGQEFFRHEGFFPEDELVKVLKTKGVTEQ